MLRLVICRDAVIEWPNWWISHTVVPQPHLCATHSSCWILARASWTTRWIHEYSHRYVECLHTHNADSIATSPRVDHQVIISVTQPIPYCDYWPHVIHHSWPSNQWCHQPLSMSRHNGIRWSVNSRSDKHGCSADQLHRLWLHWFFIEEPVHVIDGQK